MKEEMNIKKNWLKSLTVAAVVAMASANASAEILTAMALNGQVSLGPTPIVFGGMTTPTFKHPGGTLAATFTAECFAQVEPQWGTAGVFAFMEVQDAAGSLVAKLYPNNGTLCSSGAPRATFSTTGVANLPPGTFRVVVRGMVSNERASGYIGSRSIVVSH